MKKTSYFTLLVSLSILTACTQQFPTDKPSIPADTNVNENNSETPSDNSSIQPDQAFNLTVGESLIFQPAGLTIEFLEVKSDSRCPSDVVCVWAGEATVHIKATTQGPAVEADLIIPGTTKNSVNLKGDVGVAYDLKLLDLKPYPNSKISSEDSKYQATFIFNAAE